MLRKRISVLVTSLAVVAGGLAFGAAPASAAVRANSISVTQWPVNSTTAVTVSWRQTNDVTSSMVRSPWPWVSNWTPNAGFAATGGTATRGIQTITCTQNGVAIVFTFSDAAVAAGPAQPTCKFANSYGTDGFTGFWIENNLTIYANSTVSVAIPSGQVAAPSSARRDTWIVGPYSPSWNSSEQAEIATVAIGPDGEVSPPPTIRLDINGNGGVCTPSFVEGEQGTWGKAPTADKCTFGSRQLQGFSTSPTLAPGSVFVPPGGSVYFLTANLLYAIWASTPTSAPQDVVATPGLNSVKVTWKAPADQVSSTITNYLAQATPSGKVCITRVSDADMLTCTFDLPATNTQYAFKVQALNSAGWSPMSTESAAVSPYDFRDVTASRPNILLGLGGSRVEASGLAPGLAGKAVNAQFKVGSAKDWTTQANAATVNAQGKFSWSRKFGPSLNKQNVSVRFTYGTDLVSGTYVLSRGGQAGSLTAPRNIKVENAVNRVIVTWDPPKFDGGEKITGYTMCAAGAGILCRNVSTDGRGIFQGLDPKRSYTITVAAKTANRTGPAAEVKQKVSPVEASVQITRRIGQEIRVETQAAGFKESSKFRLEVAIAAPGKPTNSWGWNELQAFTGKGNVNRGFAEELGASYEGKAIAVRLVTLNGTVYSKISRP